MTPEEYVQLHPQSKKFVCQDHGCHKVRSAIDGWVCIFCESEEWQANATTQSELDE